uniref:MRN complex-interacting protein N-terminal domain-containing protein n=1 Tax=Anopheles epiroticus TaxID=199890 RepID=A0A182P785_9DIPT
MPQELRVVRCFQCLKYQVDIVKKANKWVCKLCGSKQSLTREYFRGSGKDCRMMVQQLSIRHLEMDQREAEVAELVVQNKIQLPQPPVERVVAPCNESTASGSTSQGPSKWATFITKKENEDSSEELDACGSLESVSSSTFDREHIACPIKKASAWGNHQTVLQDVSDSDATSASKIGSGFSPTDSWPTKQNSAVLNPNRSTKWGNRSTNSFQTTGATKRWNQNSGESSMQLPAFHRKEGNNKSSFADCTRTFPQSTVGSKTPAAPEVSSVGYKPPQMPSKRKCTGTSSTTPLMNFAKRPTAESASTVTISNQPSGHFKDNKVQQASTSSNVSSKWAKFLLEDDETNENTDNNMLF